MIKEMSRIRNKRTAEINVCEEDGTWGDYTGVFYCNEKDATKIVIDKAQKHYDKHFKDGVWYEKKTLGLFLTTPTHRKLVKILKNTGNKPKETI